MLSIISCDRDNRGNCDYQAKATCREMPLTWGDYCNYEKSFISSRHKDLVDVFDALKRRFHKGEKWSSVPFKLNHTILWEICFIYANDLKPVRQFHAIDGGCDRNRRAAFLARLIAMHRPIHIEEFIIPDSKALQGEISLKMNELFALNAMMHFLMLPASLFADARIEKVAADLMFIFGHRDPQPESLVCIARLITGVNDQFQRANKAESALRELSAPTG